MRNHMNCIIAISLRLYQHYLKSEYLEFNFKYMVWLRFSLEMALRKMIHSGRNFMLTEKEMLIHLSDYRKVIHVLPLS